jgi:hypothetical protein
MILLNQGIIQDASQFNSSHSLKPHVNFTY